MAVEPGRHGNDCDCGGSSDEAWLDCELGMCNPDRMNMSSNWEEPNIRERGK